MDKVYLDTNAFYFFFFEHEKYTKGIKKMFEKIQRGACVGVTTCLTLDELAYVILMRLIEQKYKKHPMTVLRQSKSTILEFVKQIQEVFDVVFSFENLEIVKADKNVVGMIPTLMENALLLPRDCVHLRTMLDAGCTKILSTDTDFDNVDGIERIKPESMS